MNFADKKVIVFDLDGTIATSKLPITAAMADLLEHLLKSHQVCIISGEKFEQFQKQVLSKLDQDSNLANLHIMPTCGTRYFRFQEGDWEQIYSEDLPAEDREKIVQTLTEGAKQLGLWPEKAWGEIVEDRGTQVTYSALGQEAPIESKLAWDPDGAKRMRLRKCVLDHLDDYEVDVSGTTSVDVTRKGIDKAYGVKKLEAVLHLANNDLVFIGDQLRVGGNDHPVKALGIDSIEVEDWHETAKVIKEDLDR
ncbi:MAG TPA: HAD-IIB family hydrolase [Candidatus Saccharimonadia bacterium]|nr:HAD-IIB family hydrolase [Candidatus Saccharimonadia bacterium]